MADINKVWEPLFGTLEFTNGCTKADEQKEMDFKQGKNITMDFINNIEPTTTQEIEGNSVNIISYESINPVSEN